jgi:L-alanine-DL-glutamate epimerase-like enolase superfamily enzyme
MRINSIEMRLVEQPIKTGFEPSWGKGIHMKSLPVTVIKIGTDEGIEGISGGPTSAFEVISGTEAFLKNSLLGMDPFNTEQISAILENAVLRMGWPWFIEAAVWDIIGKKTNQPVYKLFGSVKEKMRVYASTGEVRPLGERLEMTSAVLAQGYNALKLRFYPGGEKELLETIGKLREKYGAGLSIMVDANRADSLPGTTDGGSWYLHDAINLAKELGDLQVLWLEEPLARYDYEGLKSLRSVSPIPIAGGEKNKGLSEFRELLLNQCYDILQPDSMFSGGFTIIRKIAALAETFNKRIIPHTWSTGFGLLANLQMAAALPGCEWFEYPYDPPSWDHELNFELFEERPKIENGYIYLPQKAGLGYSVNWEKIESYSVHSVSWKI